MGLDYYDYQMNSEFTYDFSIMQELKSSLIRDRVNKWEYFIVFCKLIRIFETQECPGFDDLD